MRFKPRQAFFWAIILIILRAWKSHQPPIASPKLEQAIAIDVECLNARQDS